MTHIIDIHPHVICPDTNAYPLDPLGGMQSNWSSAHPITHDDLIREMDSAGVAKAVLVQASTAYGHDNSYLADAVAAHPDRFTGVFSIDVLAPDAVEKIKHWQGRNLTGLRLFMTGSTMPGQAGWLADERANPAWEYVSEAGLPVCLQMRAEGIPDLETVIARFPDIRFVLDHLARPVLSDGPPYAAASGLFGLAKAPNVHLKLTLRNLEAAAQGQSSIAVFLDHLLGAFGSHRIAWGSNFPAAERPLGELVAAILSATERLAATDREAILSGTALSLYPALKEGH